MIHALAHIALRVKDIDASLVFYAKLGIHEAFRLHHDNGSLFLVYLHVQDDQFIELFPGGTGNQGQNSFMHICLACDDVHAEVQRLQAVGIQIDSQPKVGLDHNLQAWIQDPDGNAIELMQLAEHSPQRKTARGEPAGF